MHALRHVGYIKEMEHANPNMPEIKTKMMVDLFLPLIPGVTYYFMTIMWFGYIFDTKVSLFLQKVW